MIENIKVCFKNSTSKVHTSQDETFLIFLPLFYSEM